MDESPAQLIIETIDAFNACFRKLSEKQADCKRAA